MKTRWIHGVVRCHVCGYGMFLEYGKRPPDECPNCEMRALSETMARVAKDTSDAVSDFAALTRAMVKGQP